MISVEIIAIGSELLRGIVLDTNTNWLCKQITGLGGQVKRVTIVPDELKMIAEALKSALRAKRDVIITSGGLGPTQDDMTLQAVAYALKLKIVLNEDAHKMIAQRYADLAKAGRVTDAALTASRQKMALLPQGAIPLANRVGTAPGAYLEHKSSKIICLPGVPAELKDIFQNSLPPFLKNIFSEGFYLEKDLIVQLNDESILAPILKELNARWPKVYIKSRPKGFAEGLKIIITFSLAGSKDEVQKVLNGATEDLKKRLKQENIPVENA